MEANTDSRLAEQVCELIYRECDVSVLVDVTRTRGDAELRQLADHILSEQRLPLNQTRKVAVIDAVVASMTGLGQIDSLLADPDISEIMINGPDSVFIEKNGQLSKTSVAFRDDEHVRQIVDRIIAPLGRRLDALSPMVDARLPDGSRLNAVIPPLSFEGTSVTIRRFLHNVRTIDDLIDNGSCKPDDAALITSLVKDRANVIVSGGTGAGKTTLLGAAMSLCDESERIIIIEDAAELPCDHVHRVRLEARPATFASGTQITIRELLRNALRMRPDRIVLGEVRGVEAYDLVQALNTGHRGCWSTVHSNGVEDALLRIEAMALVAEPGTPQLVLRNWISRAVDCVVHVERDASGVRSVVDVAMVEESDGAGAWRLRRR